MTVLSYQKTGTHISIHYNLNFVVDIMYDRKNCYKLFIFVTHEINNIVLILYYVRCPERVGGIC